MLIQIHISNLITIQTLSIDLTTGTTVLTGETGTGKSILIDAIELALGGRASEAIVRPGQEKADISLCFDLSKLPAARAWLKNYDLLQADECIIRRTINHEGRSRSYINGMPTTLQPLRELSELLIDIHGQHEHQSLLKIEKQRAMLDEFAGHISLVDKTRDLAQEWHALNNEILTLRKLANTRTLRSEFLAFQLNEIAELNITPDEFEALDLEHKQLAHADELLQQLNQALNYLAEEPEKNATRALNQALEALLSVQKVAPKIIPWIENLKNAMLQINETENELHRYLAAVELDPARLTWVEERISTLFNLARKHKISPNELFDFQQKLTVELHELNQSDERLNQLSQQLITIEKNYFTAAKKLSQSRAQAAKKLAAEITKILRELALPHAEFHIELNLLETLEPVMHGLEKITFQIKTNAGQTLQPLAKIASGGELSRISLAIYMATAAKHTTPTLIFDEVDVGISGGTAEIVGKLLRHLGSTHQVLCVTHLPQVAAQGHQHLRVEKHMQANVTYTHIRQLDRQEKIQEIARMLGGVTITQKTLAHAQEMVEAE